MKYVIFKFLGAELPVIFPSDIFNHDNIQVISAKFGDGIPVSAGTCEIYSKDGEWRMIPEVSVSGDFYSLGIKSRKQDADIIKAAIKEN